MAKLFGNYTVSVKEVKEVKQTLELFAKLLNDERLPKELNKEYVNKFKCIMNNIEFEEYCENGANAHKEME